MFNACYLDAMCNRWKHTHDESDRVKARRLIDGPAARFLCRKDAGFYCAGIATGGKTTYPMAQTIRRTAVVLWHLALPAGRLATGKSGDAGGEVCGDGEHLERNGWRMPCDGPPSAYRGSFQQNTGMGPRTEVC